MAEPFFAMKKVLGSFWVVFHFVYLNGILKKVILHKKVCLRTEKQE